MLYVNVFCVVENIFFGGWYSYLVRRTLVWSTYNWISLYVLTLNHEYTIWHYLALFGTIWY